MPRRTGLARGAAASSPDKTRAHLRRLAYLLDESIRLPGTSYRIGLDGLVGLIPGVGDLVGTAFSVYILYEAHRLGVPKGLLLRMTGNIVLDTLLGAVPVVGDVFDFAWKANRRNLTLMETYLQRVRGPS